MNGIREVVLRRPVHIDRGAPRCTECSTPADDERHTTTVAECDEFRADMGRCPEPSAHHQYRAQPWWRRIRREHSREGWW